MKVKKPLSLLPTRSELIKKRKQRKRKNNKTIRIGLIVFSIYTKKGGEE